VTDGDGRKNSRFYALSRSLLWDDLPFDFKAIPASMEYEGAAGQSRDPDRRLSPSGRCLSVPSRWYCWWSHLLRSLIMSDHRRHYRSMALASHGAHPHRIDRFDKARTGRGLELLLPASGLDHGAGRARRLCCKPARVGRRCP